ncbi:hypothetical protein GCM10023107_53490 [Actinoplanes octamycinicus]|nr:DUF6325 family protein [Actinoplanes octamycinicus]GIE59504.1 hypothetical protein Aoc01nite_49060 [Actinoplanes octamycinicus]
MPDLDEMGPVDYLCIEFPHGSLTGKALPLLLDLVDQQTIRILDLLFVRKATDGSVVALDGTELEVAGLGAFHGAASGILGGDDLREIGTVLAPGAAAVVLVYENTWAAPLARTLREVGAQLVAGGRIPIQHLLAALDETEADHQRDEQSTITSGS